MIMTNWLYVKFLRSLCDHFIQLRVYNFWIKVDFVSLLSKSVIYLRTNSACVMEQVWDTVLLCPTDYNGPLITQHSISVNRTGYLGVRVSLWLWSVHNICKSTIEPYSKVPSYGRVICLRSSKRRSIRNSESLQLWLQKGTECKTS